MDKSRIRCPQCQHEFDVSEAIVDGIRDQVESRLVGDHEQRLQQKIAEMEQRQSQVERDSQRQFSDQIKSLQTALQEQQQKTRESQKQELVLREQARKIELRQQGMDLEVARAVDQARATLGTEIRNQLDADFGLKLREKEQQVQGLRDALTEARRRSEQGSQEGQGEALEQGLEAELRSLFPEDEFAPVSKGVRGADIVQRVRNAELRECGVILWEMKNTKNWSPAWLQKLKDDQRDINAQFAILVTMTLPPTIKRFGWLDGVWVTDMLSIGGLVSAIRQQIISVEFARAASKGQHGKMELVYDYLISDAFRHKVEAMAESYEALELQLIRERRAMEKQWKEREQLIRRMTNSTVGLYGEIKGIVGQTLPEIKQLELDGGEDE